MMTMRKTNGSMPRRPDPAGAGEAAGVCARKRKSMAVKGCQFVALAVNHSQGRTSGFLESTCAPKMQDAEPISIRPSKVLRVAQPDRRSRCGWSSRIDRKRRTRDGGEA